MVRWVFVLGFGDKNVPGNQLLYCDLAEIYYLLFPVQVNALALQFTRLLLILAFAFWISAFSFLPETPALLTARATWCFLSFQPEEEWNNSL